MRYRIQTGSEEHQVTLEQEGAGYVVEVDGQTHRVVPLDHVAGPRAMLVGDRVVRVELAERPRIDGRFTDAVVQSASAGAARGRSRQLHGGTLKSPMPGRVLRVCVSVGDLVTARTEVLVVEAMKMENQLFAPCDGRVEAILVKVGDTVEAQAALLSISAQPPE
jgi:biotin carboxyl carrier protein